MTLEIRTAEELADPVLQARWRTRRAARERDVLQRILRTFVEHGGPIPVDGFVGRFPDPQTVRDALDALGADDLIRMRDGHIDVAYPFAAVPTPFVVRLQDGTDRYACCATDALGVAPMTGQRVHVASRCHHSGAPLSFAVGPDAPSPEAHGVMVWFGKYAENCGPALDSL